MKNSFVILSILLAITFGKESSSKTKGKDKTDSESDQKSDDVISNQCCSVDSPECCISLTYSSSSSGDEEIPEEFGGIYYCETMDVTVSDKCNGNLDFIALPLSKSCDLTRTIWDLRGAKDFQKAIKSSEGDITINNAMDYLLSANDPQNPTGKSALKFTLDGDDDNKQITICTQLGEGEIVDKIDDNDIEIGFSVDEDRFKCKNSTIRDICGIDTSGIVNDYGGDKAEEEISNVMVRPRPRNNNNYGGEGVEPDDPRFDEFVGTFEYYWNQWVGLGIAVFAASIFFNMVMCIYWSGLRPVYDDSVMNKKMKVMIDDGSDDETEEESDDTDESITDDQHI